MAAPVCSVRCVADVRGVAETPAAAAAAVAVVVVVAAAAAAGEQEELQK